MMPDTDHVTPLADGRSDRTGRTTQLRRALIINTAVSIFAELGFDGASIRDIADALDVKKGNIYYYFKAKEDILFAIVDEVHDAFVQLTEGPTRDDAHQTLREVLVRHIELSFKLGKEAIVSEENYLRLTPSRLESITEKRHTLEAYLEGLIEASRSSGKIDPDCPTSILMKAMFGVVNFPVRAYSPVGAYSVSDLAQLFADRALAALQPIV